MLKDSRSDRFVGQFVRRWLDWDNIGEMPVSEDFGVYFRDNLESAMAGETKMFFRHILNENLPPKRFLDADYTFVNRELAAPLRIGAGGGQSPASGFDGGHGARWADDSGQLPDRFSQRCC